MVSRPIANYWWALLSRPICFCKEECVGYCFHSTVQNSVTFALSICAAGSSISHRVPPSERLTECSILAIGYESKFETKPFQSLGDEFKLWTTITIAVAQHRIQLCYSSWPRKYGPQIFIMVLTEKSKEFHTTIQISIPQSVWKRFIDINTKYIVVILLSTTLKKTKVSSKTKRTPFRPFLNVQGPKYHLETPKELSFPVRTSPSNYPRCGTRVYEICCPNFSLNGFRSTGSRDMLSLT